MQIHVYLTYSSEKFTEYAVTWNCRRRALNIIITVADCLILSMRSKLQCTLIQDSHASLKVLEFFSPKFKALKVLENRTGA